MENPNETWDDFSTRIIQRDVSYQVSSNLLNDEDQTKVQLASLGQEMKIVRSELHEHQFNGLGNSQLPDPSGKNRQKRHKVLQLLPHQRTHSRLVQRKSSG